jgi:hypothetical protein
VGAVQPPCSRSSVGCNRPRPRSSREHDVGTASCHRDESARGSDRVRDGGRGQPGRAPGRRLGLDLGAARHGRGPRRPGRLPHHPHQRRPEPAGGRGGGARALRGRGSAAAPHPEHHLRPRRPTLRAVRRLVRVRHPSHPGVRRRGHHLLRGRVLGGAAPEARAPPRARPRVGRGVRGSSGAGAVPAQRGCGRVGRPHGHAREARDRVGGRDGGVGDRGRRLSHTPVPAAPRVRDPGRGVPGADRTVGAGHLPLPR